VRSAAIEVVLTASQTACLHALRDGLVLKSRIAVRVRRDLKTVAAALEELGRLHLARRSGRYRWGTTRRGRDCKVNEIPDPARRRGGKAYGRIVPSAGAARLLAVLDRPMSGADLARRLGVSHQRAHQLVFKLYALGLVRLGDEDRPLHVVARTDDPSVLLLGDEVRVLSVVPDDFTTTLSKIRMAARFPAKRTEAALANLRVEGLVEVIAGPRGNRLYRLTTAGQIPRSRRRSRSNRTAFSAFCRTWPRPARSGSEASPTHSRYRTRLPTPSCSISSAGALCTRLVAD
jgi:hypothetical protein